MVEPLVQMREDQMRFLSILTDTPETTLELKKRAEEIGLVKSKASILLLCKALARRRFAVNIDGKYQITATGSAFKENPVTDIESELYKNGPMTRKGLYEFIEAIDLDRHLKKECGADNIKHLKHYFPMSVLPGLAVAIRTITYLHEGEVEEFALNPNLEDPWACAMAAGALLKKAQGKIPYNLGFNGLMPDKFLELPDYSQCPDCEMKLIWEGTE